MPTLLGDHIVTRAELEACCQQYPMAQALADVPSDGQGKVIAGIDWGGGGRSRTVMVIGYMRDDFTFVVCRMERFVAQEDPSHVLAEVAERCAQFQVRVVAADGGGNGYVYNRLLLERLNHRLLLYAIHYSTADHMPRKDGFLWRWTVNRSNSLGTVFSRVKKRLIVFPAVTVCGTFLDEIACEVAEYDDIDRSIKYTHPETLPDDALHATNYAVTIAVWAQHGAFHPTRKFFDD